MTPPQRKSPAHKGSAIVSWGWVPTLDVVAMWVVAIVIASAGGLVASLIGTPLPWLLGAMMATAIAMALGVRVFGHKLGFPQPVRMGFITIIGVAIGGTATPDILAEVPDWWPSLVAVVVFVAGAQTVNYQIFRRIGGYDKPTAYYCATPGGLIESVQLGEEAGGNPALLAVQHFSRISITVVLVPLLYWAARGEAVGSAAGVSLDAGTAPLGLGDVVILAACAFLGGWGGRRIGIPAAIITGPILLSAAAHMTGLTGGQLPEWLISVAQLIVGLGLAARFQDITPRLIVQGVGLGALTVFAMLSIGGGIAAVLASMGSQSMQVLFMCFAPGGVVEMGLIALSLQVSPVMVTLHHIVRIVLTVMAVPIAARLVLRSQAEDK